jgi:hypothetical protein
MSTRHIVAVAALLSCALPLSAQWTNRYQRIGQGHHVYVEGYDFPTYSVGPTYPAISPDGSTVAFSARGWLWIPVRPGTLTVGGLPSSATTHASASVSWSASCPGTPTSS